jgi:hypothetical protein
LRRSGPAIRFVDAAQLEAVFSGRLSLSLIAAHRVPARREASQPAARSAARAADAVNRVQTGKPGTSAHFAKLLKSFANLRFRAPTAKIPNRARFTKYW